MYVLVTMSHDGFINRDLTRKHCTSEANFTYQIHQCDKGYIPFGKGRSYCKPFVA